MGICVERARRENARRQAMPDEETRLSLMDPAAAALLIEHEDAAVAASVRKRAAAAAAAANVQAKRVWKIVAIH